MSILPNTIEPMISQAMADNSIIAEKVHMSLSGVKQAIRIVSEKTGVSRDEFAVFL